MADFAGFWSYVHDDDRNSGGRVLSLSERLAEAFQLLSADPLKLFVDRDLQWGDEWEKRIANALQQTTFFIPIVTPSYFRHDECRKELLNFAGAAKQFGVEQLLLPIYYVKVDELEAEGPPTDEAMAIIKRTQWVDFRDVRLLGESDSEHCVLVDKLASRLLQAAEDIEDQPPLEPPESAGLVEVVASSEVDGGSESDSEEGYLELLAKGEVALPLWTETVQAIGAEIAKFGELTDESSKEMQAEEDAGTASFAGRLATANKFAVRLQGPADRLVDLGSEYVAHLFDVDSAVRTMIRFAKEDEDVRAAEGVQTLFRSIFEMAQVSRESMNGAQTLSGIIGQNAGFSRELRKPLKKIEGALRNMVDAQSILDGWADDIDGLLD